MSERRQQARRGDTALTLFGVTVADSHTTTLQVPDASLVTVRNLGAIVADVEYRPIEPGEVAARRAAAAVSAYAVHGPVLPAPVGVVFRSSDSVERWLELHYGAMSESLSYVENRVGARVHVWRPGHPDERDVGADLASVAAESMRVLRRAAVASVPLRTEQITGIVLSAAFLVDEERWKNFVDEVEAQAKTEQSVRFEVTGPWPCYDFIQMQMGG